jgi:hypothetical protein
MTPVVSRLDTQRYEGSDDRLGIWIGPLIAVVLALRLRPALLAVFGLTALAGFVVSFNTAQSRYPDCEECP